MENNFFNDCDTILTIHYNHYFIGPYGSSGKQLWMELSPFIEICQNTLERKDYGYIQAIHFQLTSDGYLDPIGVLHDLTIKVHKVTPKGFAFYSSGGYRQRVKQERKKLQMNLINTTSSTLGWLVALGVGIFSYYKDSDEIENKIINLEKRISQSELKSETLLRNIPKNLLQLQIPETNADSGQLATKMLRKQ